MSLYWRPADGSGDAELLMNDESPQLPGSWSPDGRVLVFSTVHPDTGYDLWVLVDGTPQEFVVTDAHEQHAMFSPNGQWIAYDSDRSGQLQVHLRPYPGPGGEQLVSTAGGERPRWSRNGREVFYQTRASQVMAVSVETTPSVELSTPQLLFEVPNLYQGFDVHPDGERFVIVRSVGSGPSTTQLNVILNWAGELTERATEP